MSRERYRFSTGGDRWDSERLAIERDRHYGGERERFEERDTRITRGGYGGRVRERSVDEVYERRGPRDFEDDRYERRAYYEEEPRFGRDRKQSITIEKERVYSPSPARRGPVRPGFLRRQSSLDTFDRRPVTRYVEREEYGPPARYREDIRLPPLTPIPLPRSRGLPPPRSYEREYYDEIEIAEPDYYGDDRYRAYPERFREREIIRKRRSRSRGSRVTRSVRSSSTSSSSSSDETEITVRSEFPKRGKTRIPGRLVSRKAIIDLGYPYEEDGETIVILKALGRENIDEVIKLSEDYKKTEVDVVHIERGRSDAGTVIEERRESVLVSPTADVVRETKIIEEVHPHHHHHHGGAVVIEAGPREESVLVGKRDIYERSDPIPVGPLALAIPAHREHVRDERAIRAEIKALEAEKYALRAERRADREIRRTGRGSETDLVLYERDHIHGHGEDVTIVKKERIEEPDGGVRIERNRKAPPPALIRAMLKTLT